MPIDTKEGFSLSAEVRKAAERRALDEKSVKIGRGTLERRTNAILALKSPVPYAPPVQPGSVLDARSWTNYVQDAKMHISILASGGESLQKEIELTSQKNFAALDDLQREALALDAFVTEEEVKVRGRYTTVHFNSFTRQLDANRSYRENDWLKDYKTGLVFLSDNMADVVQGSGMTLPLREEVEIPVVDAVLVGEETDVGDTKHPIVSTDPRNLLRANRIFRHVIIRREHDNTSRRYRKTPSYCTVLLELGGLQLINTLTVRPVAHSTVYIEDISYLNEADEEVSLSELEIASEVNTTVFFQPVRAKYLKVKFRQYAPVGKLSYDAGDRRVAELNELLRGAGFSQLLNEDSEEIQGRVYDFSLDTLKVSLRVYENLGLYRSQPVRVSSPIGINYSDTIETIQVTTNKALYGNTYFLNEGEVLVERYLGVDLKTREGAKAMYDLVPVPDDRATQREFLPLLGGESRVKLFPDLRWNLKNKTYWDSALWASGFLVITFNDGHGFDADPYDQQYSKMVVIAGPGEAAADFSITSEWWYVTNANTIVVNPAGTGLASGQTENLKITPYVFLETEQDDPLNVFKEDEQLVFPTDYQVSFDSGSTWLSEWPRDDRWNELRSAAQAGTFYIKILNPDESKLYYVDYKFMSNQQLSKKAGVKLRKGRVLFDKSLKDTSGTITSVIVNRAESPNMYMTPILSSYFLKVREHVS